MRLEISLKVYEFHLSKGTTTHMKYNFSEMRNIYSLEVKVGYHIIHQVTHLKYISWIRSTNDGETERDINH